MNPDEVQVRILQVNLLIANSRVFQLTRRAFSLAVRSCCPWWTCCCCYSCGTCLCLCTSRERCSPLTISLLLNSWLTMGIDLLLLGDCQCLVVRGGLHCLSHHCSPRTQAVCQVRHRWPMWFDQWSPEEVFLGSVSQWNVLWRCHTIAIRYVRGDWKKATHSNTLTLPLIALRMLAPIHWSCFVHGYHLLCHEEGACIAGKGINFCPLKFFCLFMGVFLDSLWFWSLLMYKREENEWRLLHTCEFSGPNPMPANTTTSPLL